jgi:hypothetical protein
MTRRELIGMLAVGGTAMTLGGCLASPRKICRFRMMVEIDTPQGLRTGSSVMELSGSRAAFKLPDSKLRLA